MKMSDFGPPNLHDKGNDQGPSDGGGPSGASLSPTDPLEHLIQKLDDLATMNGPDITAVLDDLPVPQRGKVPSMAMQEALKVKVCCVLCVLYGLLL
jgi:hypothetical protein